MNTNLEIRFMQLGLVFFMIILLSVFTDLVFYSLLGLGLFLFFSLKFFSDLGSKIQIKDLMILLALLQWIIGPVLAYRYDPDNQFYYMAVDETVYMSYVFPASLLFVLGLYFPLWNKRTNAQIHLDNIRKLIIKYPRLDLILLAIGVFSELLIEFAPSALRFVLYLFSGARFIGLYFLIMSNKSYKWTLSIAMFFWLTVSAVSDAMFHDLLLWIGFLMIILAFIYHVSIEKKVLAFTLIFVSGFLIQTVKYEFRSKSSMVSSDYGKLELFVDLIFESAANQDILFSGVNMRATITRINQGWIIARIMSYTPRYEPFADGETVIASLKAILLPRFLAPNKAKAGGHAYFERFTGKKLGKWTSMNLSTLGEAYANYGVWGGSIFMFILGVFYNFFIYNIFQIAIKRPSIILFLPLLFLQVVKAETDIAIVLNHLMKASIAIYLLFWGLERFLGIKL